MIVPNYPLESYTHGDRLRLIFVMARYKRSPYLLILIILNRCTKKHRHHDGTGGKVTAWYADVELLEE